MKCGICGSDQQVIYKPRGYRGYEKDENGNLVPQLKEDGTVRTAFMYGLGNVIDHKKLEHPEEFKAAEEKKAANKAANKQRARLESSYTRDVHRAAGKAVAVLVLEYDEYWKNKTHQNRKSSPYTLGFSYEYVHGTEDYARLAVREGRGFMPSDSAHVRQAHQVTHDQAAELQAIDVEIEALQEKRDRLARGIYESTVSVTYEQLIEVVEAREAAIVELNRMLEEEELEGPSTPGSQLTWPDIEIIMEAAMSNHPEVFFRSEPMPEEQLQDALSAYGYQAGE